MRRKRLILIPFAALAAATALAATAFACTVFRGTFTISGNDPTSGSVTATGSGGNLFMTQSVSAGIAKATRNGGSVTVSTGASGTNKLPASTGTQTYKIRFYNSTAGAPGYNTHTTWKTDCMVGSSGTQIGTVKVDSTGKISSGSGMPSTGQPETFPLLPTTGLTPDVSPAESAVCISDDSASNGNEAPLTIL